MDDEDIDAIALLQDPVRRRLYEFVAARGREVGRNEAAESAGVSRTLAAFHLDKLVDAGLLEAGSRRLTGRSGPGAGRPAKVYRRSDVERGVSVPARDYGTAAELLAEAAEAAGLDAELQEAARRRGRALSAEEPPGPGPVAVPSAGPSAGPSGERSGAPPGFEGVLARRGYAPVRDEGEDGSVVLRMRNCPFHVVAEAFPPLVCGMNLALLEGMAEGVRGVRVRMEARPGWCCAVAEEVRPAPDGF